MTTDAHDERDTLARRFASEIPRIVQQYDEAVAKAAARYEEQLAERFADLAEATTPDTPLEVPAPTGEQPESELAAVLRAIAAEGEVERIRDGVSVLLAEVADTTDDGAQFIGRLRTLVFPPGRDQPTIVVDANSPEPPPFDPPEAHVTTAEEIAADVDRQITDPTYPAPRRVTDNPQA